MERLGVTIDRHIISQQQLHPGATGEFSQLLSQIAFAGKVVAREVNKAGLVEIIGLAGSTNVQGEQVQKLDVYANETFKRCLEYSGLLCAMASEEEDDLIPIPEQYAAGHYVFNFDPLDGSSNIDANVSIGTIFSIHHKASSAAVRHDHQDCLQPGSKQVCAGYIIYGSSTMLVYTTGQKVWGFTLDPTVGAFLLSHPDIQIPPKGKIYSINEGNWHKWDDSVRGLIGYLKTPDKASGRPYSSRYIGSLVADFHRNLLYGGIFMYPADQKNPNGKLRLLYECSPLAMVVEAAGGAASTGHRRILDIVPTELHQRVPLYIGSREDVALAEAFIQGRRAQ